MEELVISRNCYTQGGIVNSGTPVTLKPNPDRIAVIFCVNQQDCFGRVTYKDPKTGVDVVVVSIPGYTQSVQQSYGGDTNIQVTTHTHPGVPQLDLTINSFLNQIHYTECILRPEFASRVARAYAKLMGEGNG